MVERRSLRRTGRFLLPAVFADQQHRVFAAQTNDGAAGVFGVAGHAIDQRDLAVVAALVRNLRAQREPEVREDRRAVAPALRKVDADAERRVDQQPRGIGGVELRVQVVQAEQQSAAGVEFFLDPGGVEARRAVGDFQVADALRATDATVRLAAVIEQGFRVQGRAGPAEQRVGIGVRTQVQVAETHTLPVARRAAGRPCSPPPRSSASGPRDSRSRHRRGLYLARQSARPRAGPHAGRQAGATSVSALQRQALPAARARRAQ